MHGNIKTPHTIIDVRGFLYKLINLPLETRNDMAEYNLKKKNALRLIYLYVDEYYRQKGIGKHLFLLSVSDNYFLSFDTFSLIL